MASRNANLCVRKLELCFLLENAPTSIIPIKQQNEQERSTYRHATINVPSIVHENPR